MKVPTTVFTGFLGSGKTTIISHLVDELQAGGQQVIYIKNEIGSENLDAQLLKGKNIQTKELLNGCICCTLVGPFIHAIDEIVETFKPTRIIIEASGAADPSALALMIDSHPKLLRDGVLAVVDVVNFDGYVDLSITAQNQTKFTDLIIFNKIELVDLARKQAVVGYVRELNTHSPIIEAPNGTVSSDVVFGVASDELTALLKAEGFEEDHSHTDHHHPHEHHLEQDGLGSFALHPSGIIEITKLEQFLHQLPASVYRVKGIIKSTDGMKMINKVGTRVSIEPLEMETQSDKNVIVIIGFHIMNQQENIRDMLSSLTQD